jgi:hypothetical protein
MLPTQCNQQLLVSEDVLLAYGFKYELVCSAERNFEPLEACNVNSKEPQI